MAKTETIGQRIRAARVRAGLSQEMLARRADLSNQTISNMERGESKATVETLQALAPILGTTVGALLGE